MHREARGQRRTRCTGMAARPMYVSAIWLTCFTISLLQAAQITGTILDIAAV